MKEEFPEKRLGRNIRHLPVLCTYNISCAVRSVLLRDYTELYRLVISSHALIRCGQSGASARAPFFAQCPALARHRSLARSCTRLLRTLSSNRARC